MRRGFTLVELIVVIIIVGVLATLGLSQYQTVIERSRGAEARQVISTLRSACAALYMQDNETEGCTAAALGLSAGAPAAGEIPGAECGLTNFFRYTVGNIGNGLDTATFTAIRCAAGGKNPNRAGATALTTFLQLVVDYAPGAGQQMDAWNSAGGY